MEDKRNIVFRLKLLLKATRVGSNIDKMFLSEDSTEVVILFHSRGKKKVNIEGDSGYAIIKDVMAAL